MNFLKIDKIRDLSLIDLEDRYIVIAVDSFGGIGPKVNDVVKLSIREWAIALLRVPLMEVIASGAYPFLVIDALGVEYEPTGRQVVEVLKSELSRLGYLDIHINGSTEDNIPVSSSAAGIVVLGLAEKDRFYPGTTLNGDELFLVGVPKSGPNESINLRDDPEIPDILDLISLRKIDGIHDMLPVGSHGVLYEALQMADTAKLSLSLAFDIQIDIKKSAGPSTCFLLSSLLPKEEIERYVTAPVFQLGKFIN